MSVFLLLWVLSRNHLHLSTGTVNAPPPVVSSEEFQAWDTANVDLQQLCKFACKHGFCPQDTCGLPVVDEWDDGSVDSGGLFDKGKNAAKNANQCQVFKTAKNRDASLLVCENFCKNAVDEAKADGRISNWGCVGNFPLDKPIPWTQYSETKDPDLVYAPGSCSCDNQLVNLVADMIIDALPIIAQVSCSLFSHYLTYFYPALFLTLKLPRLVAM